MNTLSLTCLVSAALLAVSPVAMADDDATEIDEVVSFASVSDMDTTVIEADPVEVTAALVTTDALVTNIAAPTAPTVAIPAPQATTTSVADNATE